MMPARNSLNTLQDMYEAVKQLSLYEMHRLMAVLWNELEDPARVREAKRQFKEGDRLEWFDRDTNKSRYATVLEKSRKYVTILNEDDQRIWKVPYHVFNLSQSTAELVIDANQQLTRQHCSVGEDVGFNHEGRTYYGRIERLNPKTATIYTRCEHKWRVPYKFLVKVIDAEKENDHLLIEGECE